MRGSFITINLFRSWSIQVCYIWDPCFQACHLFFDLWTCVALQCCCYYYCYDIRLLLPFLQQHFSFFPCERSTTNLLVWTHKLFFTHLPLFIYFRRSLSQTLTHTHFFTLNSTAHFLLRRKRRRTAKLLLVMIHRIRQFGFDDLNEISNRLFIRSIL